ncbi:MAG: fumarylacetoacetate hydrolase family protein [Bacteroidetes bacterium]|nr:fumarylacetoacetate hydrolase family protein [Bacteroidota bacterium]
MKIICVARNYAAHAKELNNPLPEKPVIFLKPDSAILRSDMPFFLPDFSKKMHYEGELVLKICKLGKNIKEEFAKTYYDEVTVGIDFTARDLQEECKKNGHPWEIAKAFDQSAAFGEFIKISDLPDLDEVGFHFDLNGELVQKAKPTDMIFSIDHIISYVSQFFTLKMGDLLYTGTPVGVGTVKIGDLMEGYIMDKKLLSVNIK